MTPKIAVIGCGYWGQNHIKTLQKLGALYAVSDICLEKMQTISNTYGVRALSPEQAIENRVIDAIILALPPEFHVKYILQAFAHQKNVFVEKPLSLKLHEAEAAVLAAKKHERLLMVGHLLRFHPAFEEVLRLVEQGAIGELRYIYAHRLGFGKFHEKSDALWDLAPHDLSMIFALTQRTPTKIFAHGAEINPLIAHNHAKDLVHLHMDFKKNLKGHLFVSRFSPYRERKLTLTGTKAMIVFDDLKSWEEKIQILPYQQNYNSKNVDFLMAEGKYIAVKEAMPLTKELEHFISCLETKNTPRTNGEEAVKILRVLHEASTIIA